MLDNREGKARLLNMIEILNRIGVQIDAVHEQVAKGLERSAFDTRLTDKIDEYLTTITSNLEDAKNLMKKQID
jgi:hypothetical protein